MTQEYLIELVNFWTYADGIKAEKILREFLLQKADVLRLTSAKWKKLSGKSYGGDSDPKFVKTKENLQKDFLKKIINNKLYNDIEQPYEYTHYFYNLSNELKEKINSDGLIWDPDIPANKHFYGFIDPTFYKNEEIIGYIISHEEYIFLYLTDNEKKVLEKQLPKKITMQ